ncbi:MAG: hypothetical protein Q9227_007272 [Pyrenula ochraceoflavens]
MAKTSSSPPKTSDYDPYTLPDFDHEFITPEDIDAFASALSAPEADAVTALNDWRPVHQKVKKTRTKRKIPRRTKDETREGYVYRILKWPLLLLVLGWITCLSLWYALVRLYIYGYEHFVTWTGKREKLRQTLQSSTTYDEWSDAAEKLDEYLGNQKWKKQAEYAYYDHQTVQRVTAQLTDLRRKAEFEEKNNGWRTGHIQPIEELKSLLENCIKSNFVGVENPRLYSETYIGTKDLVQQFYAETQSALKTILSTSSISPSEKINFLRHLDTNYGRTALCLSGGATFAYYHFGVVRALLATGRLPQIITGTSGGALVAALVATRTDSELQRLLVPALAYRINACADPLSVWLRRWYNTGARFDLLDWARHCSWFCRGNTTFREAYERTGRILNVSCVPSDPHSPTILANYLTSPDCVIWSAVLASAAVPGILNPVVLMRKDRDGKLAPYSFGHKWKDGSLRTDIPLKALNLHFNVNFSIVSQVNPHINLFFFSSRGTVGRPVTHRRGRGWRGGFLGSAAETALKLDLQKYLKILRHLELLPRPLGQDWSEIWLQRFSGTITLWPKSQLSDFWNILSDPTAQRLARMIRAGERSAWPKARFIQNRMGLEKLIVEGLREGGQEIADLQNGYAHLQQDEEVELGAQKERGELSLSSSALDSGALFDHNDSNTPPQARLEDAVEGQQLRMRFSRRTPPNPASPTAALRPGLQSPRRASSLVEEIRRQSAVFYDDDAEETEAIMTDEDDHDDRSDDAEEELVNDEVERGTMVG